MTTRSGSPVARQRGNIRRRARSYQVRVVDPRLADEARQLAAHLSTVLADFAPARGATITMLASAFGSSRVNQAGRDLHVTTGE